MKLIKSNTTRIWPEVTQLGACWLQNSAVSWQNVMSCKFNMIYVHKQVVISGLTVSACVKKPFTEEVTLQPLDKNDENCLLGLQISIASML